MTVSADITRMLASVPSAADRAALVRLTPAWYRRARRLEERDEAIRGLATIRRRQESDTLAHGAQQSYNAVEFLLGREHTLRTRYGIDEHPGPVELLRAAMCSTSNAVRG